MKKRNRILGALSGVVFGVIILTIVVSILVYFGNNLKFGITFAEALQKVAVMFQFDQTEFHTATQISTLSIFLVGALLSLIWLVNDLVKKHISGILFFLGSLVTFFYFGLVMMFHGNLLIVTFTNIPLNEIDWATFGEYLVLPIICVILLVALIVCFGYDMKRIYAHEDVLLLEEPEQYSSKTLFKEVFNTQEELSPEDKYVKEVMDKVNERLHEEAMLEEIPLTQDEIPAILKQKDEPEEEVIEHLPFLDKPIEEEKDELKLEDIPPFLRKDYVAVHNQKIVDIPDELKTESELRNEQSSSQVIEEKKTERKSGPAYHVSKGENGIVIKMAGSSEIKGVFTSQEEAIQYIRQNSPDSPIRIHDENGKIHSL